MVFQKISLNLARMQTDITFNTQYSQNIQIPSVFFSQIQSRQLFQTVFATQAWNDLILINYL